MRKASKGAAMPPMMQRPPMGKPGTPPAISGPTLHSVASGDSWESVASEYGVEVGALMEANGASPGEAVTDYKELVIPDGGGEAAAPMMEDEGMPPAMAAEPPMEDEAPMMEEPEEEEEVMPSPPPRKKGFTPAKPAKTAMELNSAIAGTPAADSAEWTPAEAKKFVAWVDSVVEGGVDLAEPFLTKVNKLRAKSRATRL